MVAQAISAQVSIVLTSIPENTPNDTQLYLASNLNNWQAKDAQYQLKKNKAGQYAITLPLQDKTIEFKITTGSWVVAEADPKGKPTQNHKADLGQSQTIKLNIAAWTTPKAVVHSISGNVKILSDRFSIPQLHTTRRIWIYLPPDYKTSSKRYPVIYMQDGQNLFDNATSYSGEWGVDESMQNFAQKHQFEAIVVGIDNGGAERLDEYSPFENDKYKKGGEGNRYLEFMVKTLKPFIDKTYRTLPQAKNTAIIGSSMGGLISFFGGMNYPKIFGKVGIFSPSFWFVGKHLKPFLNQNRRDLKHSRFYFVAGAHEGDYMPEKIKLVADSLKKHIPESQIHVKIDEDGTHSESYWRREFSGAIRWLFNL